MSRTAFGETSSRLLLPLLGWVGLTALCYKHWEELPRTSGLGALDNERIFLYRTDLPSPLVLPLRRDATRVWISTLLDRDRPEELRGRQSWAYGIQVDGLDKNGVVIRSWPVWFRSRHSEAATGDASAAANVTSQIANDGLGANIAFTDMAEPPASVRITTIGAAGGRVLVAAWEELPLSSTEIEQTVRSIPFDARRNFARETSPMPWDVLTLPEHAAAAQTRWQRMSAQGKEGSDYVIVPMRISTFRESWEEASFDENALRAGQAVAWNLRGPCHFEVMLDAKGDAGVWDVNVGPEGPTDLVTFADAKMSLWTVSASEILDPAVPPQVLMPGSVKRLAGSSPGWQVDVPAGTITSVHLARETGGQGIMPVFTRIVSEPRHNPVWGRGPSNPLAIDGYKLSPDMAALPTWRVGPGLLPVEVDVPEGSILRLVGRMPVPEVYQTAAATITVEEVRENLPPISVPLPMEEIASRYERYRQAPEDLTGIEGWPSEPVARFLRLAKNVRHLKMTADAIADLSIAVYTDRLVPPQRLFGFTLFDNTDVRSRYMPRDIEPWTTLYPSNIDPLVVAGQNTRVDAVVRLEPRGEPGAREESDVLPTHSVDPLGRPLARALADSTAPSNPEWTGADRTRLPATVYLKAAQPLQLQWQVQREKIGGFGQVLVDGAVVARLPVVTPAGRLRLEDLPDGAHRVEVTGIDGQFWVDAPGSGVRVRQRRVWRLADKLVVPIDVYPGERAVMHARIFGASTQARLRWRVDRSAPQLGEGAFEDLTEVQGDARLVSGPVKARWVDEDGTGVHDLGRMRIRLGQDLPPGRHFVEVEVIDGEGLWAAFDETHAPPKAEGWQNWQEGLP